MKTILRIFDILLAAVLVALAFSLSVNSFSSTSASEGGQPPAMTSNDSQSTTQPMTRPEGGDHDSESITRGLSEMLGTIAKLTGITILVLLAQKAFSLLGNRRVHPSPSHL